MAFDFSGKIAVVTGGANGIGAATARVLARCGERVAVYRGPRWARPRQSHLRRGTATARLLRRFTESLAQDLSPFGVKVCALEPGGMRTNWGARANQDTPELLSDYEPSVGAVAKALKSYWGKEVSDPVKVGQVVLRLAASDSLPAHLLTGSDAVRFAGEAGKTREAEAAQ
jgi:NAD(P)-dependent dehydrogenase (short-subunit alcohol dehydrogenase family)